ncbi:GNAT family N-acetyltransferase [Salibacterium sp. K-3]
MKLVGQEITPHTISPFVSVLPDSIRRLIGEERIHAYGLFAHHEPVCVVAAEHKDRNLVLFYVHVESTSYSDEIVLQSMLQVVEKFSRKRGAANLISFHPDEGLMERTTSRMEWTTRKSQTQFMIKTKNIDRLIESKVDDLFIQPCRDLTSRNFWTLVEKVSSLSAQWQQPCPPLSSLCQQTSYLLLKKNKVIGWLLSVENQDPHTASIARYVVLPSYRHLSISHWFFSYVLADMQHRGLMFLTLNVEHKNKKLETIVDRGFLGEVTQKVMMNRAVKKL